MNAPEKNVPKVAPVDFKTAPHFPIYMDYSATTPIDPRVADKMIPYLREQFGNPASRSHMYGWTAEAAVEEARGHVAALINADPREIIWTSGATESNNLAIRGLAERTRRRGAEQTAVTPRRPQSSTMLPLRAASSSAVSVSTLSRLSSSVTSGGRPVLAASRTSSTSPWYRAGPSTVTV